MKALDTNILIRFLTKDDIQQGETVYKLFKQAESNNYCFFIPLLVVLETIWVLESVYEISPENIINTLEDLLLMPILRFESIDTVENFIRAAKNHKADLSDLLIGSSALSSGCSAVLTFDKQAAKSRLFELLK